MITLNLSWVKNHLSTVTDCHDRILVTRHDVPLFAIVSPKDLELLERLEDEIDLVTIQERLNESTESLEEIKRELDL